MANTKRIAASQVETLERLVVEVEELGRRVAALEKRLDRQAQLLIQKVAEQPKVAKVTPGAWDEKAG